MLQRLGSDIDLLFVASIKSWIDERNDNPPPYVWRTTADEILNSLAQCGARINGSRHYAKARWRRTPGPG